MEYVHSNAISTAFYRRALSCLFILVLMTIHLQYAGASCTEEQVQKCRQAAEDDTLRSLEGGGKCSAQRYVHYTHACTVSDYRPHIDFCCCAANVKVLCCRYQQSWDRFRCSEAEDTIHTLAPKRPPLYILLPCVLGPLAILGCCIYCCVRHCRYCHNDDDEEIKWGCSCLSPEKKKNDPSHSYQFQNSHSESEPLNSLPASLLVDGKRPLEHMDGARIMPTAPALDDSADEAFITGHCHYHHPHHRSHHRHHHGQHPHSSKQQIHSHQSEHLPPSAPGSYSDPTSAGFGRQASVVSAPAGMYSQPDRGDGLAPCGGGCGGYIRQESAPCGPVAPSYSQHHHMPSVMPPPMAAAMPQTIPTLPTVQAEPGEEGLPAEGAAGGTAAAIAPPPGGASGQCPQPQYPHPGGLQHQVSVNGPRSGGPCPSCSTTVCAPPTYDESLQHQVLHQ